MKRIIVLLLLVSATSFLFAERYESLRVGLEEIMPEGARMFRIQHRLTQDEADFINDNWGDPMLGGEFFPRDRFSIYYSVDGNENPTRIVVELNEILEKYTAFHHWLIAFNADGTVFEIRMLELTNDHTYPMANGRYLRQFPGVDGNSDDGFDGVDTVTGATESSYLLHASIQKAFLIADSEGLFR